MAKTRITENKKSVVKQQGGGKEIVSSEFFQEMAKQSICNNIDPSKLAQQPFLRIARGIADTPEMDPANPDYIKGLKEGDLFNPVTRTNYGKKFAFVIVNMIEHYVRWGGDQGTTFKGQYSLSEILELEKKGEIEKIDFSSYTDCETEKDKILDTITIFALPVDYVDEGIVLLSFKRTSFKFAVQLIKRAQQVKISGHIGKVPEGVSVWETSAKIYHGKDKNNWYALGDETGGNFNFVATVFESKYRYLQEHILTLKKETQKIIDTQIINYAQDQNDTSVSSDENYGETPVTGKSKGGKSKGGKKRKVNEESYSFDD